MNSLNKFNCVVSFVILLFVAASCGNNKNPKQDSRTLSTGGDTYDKVEREGTYKNVAPQGELQTTSLEVMDQKLTNLFNRMVIKTGTVSIEIENFDESERKINEEVSRSNGFITNTASTLNASGKKQGTIQVRIPAENYDAFVQSVGKIGKVMSENISGKDVTEEFIDLEARLVTQRELERRLLQLLAEKTAKLVDVVEVEQKLSGVRQTIESTEGRIRYLKDQSSFSTLTLSLFEPSLLQTSSGGGFFYEISEAVKKGLNGFTEVLTGLITLIIAISPVIILLAIALLIFRKLWNNRKKKKEQLNLQTS